MKRWPTGVLRFPLGDIPVFAAHVLLKRGETNPLTQETIRFESNRFEGSFEIRRSDFRKIPPSPVDTAYYSIHNVMFDMPKAHVIACDTNGTVSFVWDEIKT